MAKHKDKYNGWFSDLFGFGRKKVKRVVKQQVTAVHAHVKKMEADAELAEKHKKRIASMRSNCQTKHQQLKSLGIHPNANTARCDTETSQKNMEEMYEIAITILDVLCAILDGTVVRVKNNPDDVANAIKSRLDQKYKGGVADAVFIAFIAQYRQFYPHIEMYEQSCDDLKSNIQKITNRRDVTACKEYSDLAKRAEESSLPNDEKYALLNKYRGVIVDAECASAKDNVTNAINRIKHSISIDHMKKLQENSREGKSVRQEIVRMSDPHNPVKYLEAKSQSQEKSSARSRASGSSHSHQPDPANLLRNRSRRGAGGDSGGGGGSHSSASGFGRSASGFDRSASGFDQSSFSDSGGSGYSSGSSNHGGGVDSFDGLDGLDDDLGDGRL